MTVSVSDNGRPLKAALEELYRTYDFSGRISKDPIRVPLGYRRRYDREIAGYIAASLAYGKVDLFLPVVEDLLGRMGRSPFEFVMEFRARKHGRLLHDISYRFSKNPDIVALVHVLSVLVRKHGSLEGAFMNYYHAKDPDTGAALAGFMDEAMAVDTTPVYGRNIKPRGLTFFFPSPEKGSACKRANLFLRWMVRRADIDLGLWRRVAPAKLVIPLDTHIARVSRCLGLTHRKADDWKTAIEITESLRVLDPGDPLKYDFALCHRGIAGLCGLRGCRNCVLKGAQSPIKV